jgi:hypothetical protein
MEEILFPAMAQYNVICHTEKCENAEAKINIAAGAENPYVICGVCEQQITDITAVKTPKK